MALHSDSEIAHEHAVYLGHLPRTLAHALLLVAETVAVPALILYLIVKSGHPVLGLLTVLAWRVFWVGLRLVRRSHVPTTVWIAFGLFAVRIVAALAVTSVALYLWVPIGLAAATGLFFIASSFGRRPLTMRCADDFVDMSAAAQDDVRVRAMFAGLTFWWGTVHVLCAGGGAWSMLLPQSTSVAVNGFLSVGCTIVSVGGCIVWGLWQAAKIPGLRIHLGHAPVAIPSVA